MSSLVKNIDVWRTHDLIKESDLLAVEEPLQIQVEYGMGDQRKSIDLSVTMRTPGHDFELAAGFMFTEGIISGKNDIRSIRYCETVTSEEEQGNVVRVSLQPEVDFDADRHQRNFYASSSCGVCGKQSIAQIRHICKAIEKKTSFKLDTLLQAPEMLRNNQPVFKYTGGLHASGLFTANGDLVMLREDVGRHNALDKVIGGALQSGWLPLQDHFLVVSGRASFELVQKALMAGIPVVVAVGAPSSLAAELATEAGMTLLGFVRKESFNIYCGKERLKI